MILRGRNALAPLPLIVGAAVAALTLIPFGYIVVASFDMGLDQLLELLVRPRVGELLSNTVLLLVGTLVVWALAIGPEAVIVTPASLVRTHTERVRGALALHAGEDAR